MKTRIILLHLLLLALLYSCAPAQKEVVLLFTNDTHSQIDPIEPTAKRNANLGGVARRKVLIDSLRNIYPHAILVDAGDAVQGTPYFNFYGGEVETMVLNALDYDVRTPGNHDFDNGGEALSAQLAAFEGITVSSNYTYERASLQELTQPSCIIDANGVKVGFVGLNVNPQGLFFPSHSCEITYHNPVTTADSIALQLRNEGADVVIALSHLGYEGGDSIYATDDILVQNTRYIDFVVGGHSHTTLDSAAFFTNLNGKPIAVGQTGKSGVNLGFVRLTLPANKKDNIAVDYRLYPVDARYDNRIDTAFTALLAPYRKRVDEAMNVVIGHTDKNLSAERPYGLLGYWASDALAHIASQLEGSPVDFALLNFGGIRADISAGDITRGELWASFPFTNYLSVVKLKGSDVRTLFDQIAHNGGESVSREVHLVIANDSVESVTIGGKPIDDNRCYTIATLNFVAEGGDGMTAFNKATWRKDYPGFVYEIFESHINKLTKEGENISALNDNRIVVKQ